MTSSGNGTRASSDVDRTPILRIESVTKRFGGLTALENVSFGVPPRSLFGLIGPNGSGKTTLFNVIGGQLRPDDGRVHFSGQDLTGLAPENVAKSGIGRTFQIPRLFASLSVWENVLIATHLRGGVGMARSAIRVPPISREEAKLETVAEDILEFSGLADVTDKRASDLSSGHTRLLELARALAVDPRLVMLDEPAAGLSRSDADVLADRVRALRDRGITVLLVEHNMNFVMGLCERLVVLSDGLKLAEGTPDEIRSDASVINAYLGRGRS